MFPIDKGKNFIIGPINFYYTLFFFFCFFSEPCMIRQVRFFIKLGTEAPVLQCKGKDRSWSSHCSNLPQSHQQSLSSLTDFLKVNNFPKRDTFENERMQYQQLLQDNGHTAGLSWANQDQGSPYFQETLQPQQQVQRTEDAVDYKDNKGLLQSWVFIMEAGIDFSWASSPFGFMLTGHGL